jgi:hypothetical protein
MTTLAQMKTRIAQELRRNDLTTEIANAISTAIAAYQYERFYFNQSSVVNAPATDGEPDNPWMTDAEHLIRSRAKLEIWANVLREPGHEQVKVLQSEIEAALATLKLGRAIYDSTTPGTRGAMKRRIAMEIKRSGLDEDIENAINDAIVAYEDERFYFNETRSFTFNTVIGQSRYSSSDVANLANILKFDYVKLLLNGTDYDVVQRSPEFFDEMITTTLNWPSYFGWYDEQFLLYPTPNDAYQIRIGCVRKIAAPASDAEPGNAWMTKAERLIRNRAKAELYAHCTDIRDEKEAQKFITLADEALEQLVSRTVRLTKTGPYLIRPYC